MRAAEVARPSGDQELRGFGAVAEAAVAHREKAGRGEGIKQPGQAVRVDAEPGRQLIGGHLAIGDRGEEVELHPGQQREGGDDGVLQPLDCPGLHRVRVRHATLPGEATREDTTPKGRTTRGAGAAGQKLRRSVACRFTSL